MSGNLSEGVSDSNFIYSCTYFDILIVHIIMYA